MPENNTTPPAPGAEPAKNKRKRGVLNQAQIQSLTKADQICTCALKAAYAPALTNREIVPAFVPDLQDDIATARQSSALAVQNTTSKETATGDETTAEGLLLKALQEVRTAAKQKYALTDRTQLRDYYVGTRIDANRPQLEQVSQAIITKLGDDTLPGITSAKVTNLVNLRQAYIDANASQGDAQSSATLTRSQLDAAVQTITKRRLTIQLAADAEWPHTDPANAAVRKEFALPLNKPFNV